MFTQIQSVIITVFSQLIIVLSLTGCQIRQGPGPEVELYPTWNAVGLEISYPEGLPMDEICTFQWRTKGGDWRPGVEPTFYKDERRALASIWPLDQDTIVEVRLTVPGLKKLLTYETRTRRILLESSGGRIVHVSPEGKDSASGTAADPLGSIANATRDAGPGDKIVLHEGVYREGNLFAGLIGLPGKPLTIEAAKGEKPVLDGSVEIPAGAKGWKKEKNGLWSIMIDPPSAKQLYVAQDGLRMFWFKSLENARQGGVVLRYEKTFSEIGRGWFYDKESGRLFIKTGDNRLPREHVYNVAVISHGALLSGSEHIVVKGLVFRYYASSGVHLADGAKGCIIYGNRIHNTQRGITFDGQQTRNNLIIYNEVSERGLMDFTWSQIKTSEYGRQGIDGVAGRGNSFCHNTIHGFFDGIAPALWDNPGQFQRNRDMDIMFNRFYNIGDDAIEVEGGGLNVRVHGNTMRNCFVAISLATIEHGPTYVTRNDATYHFIMFKINSGVANNGHTYCYHNSAYCLNRGDEFGGTAISFHSPTQGSTDNKHFFNNTFICDGYGLRFDIGRYRIDHNCYFNVPGENPVLFLWQEQDNQGTWIETSFTSLKKFIAASGHEEHGILADPLFHSTEGMGSMDRVAFTSSPFAVYPQAQGLEMGNMHLLPDSPCIDSGIVIPGINDNTADGKPDIGAFEF